MAVLVTGGAGYVGSITARALRQRGHDVVLLDKRSPADVARIVDAVPIQGDVGDATLVAGVLREQRIDAVAHLAGLKSVEASLAHPGEYFANNVAATLVLLRAMVAAGVDRLVFSSTAAVYSPEAEPPVTESSPVDPQAPYGETKLAAERMLRWFERPHGLRAVSLRYFNAAGATEDGLLGERWDDAVNLIPVVMRAVAGRQPALTVHGRDYPTPDGTALRDYVHVEDLAEAHVRALDYLAGGGPTTVLNLGTGRPASVLEVVAAVERASGRTVPIVVGPRRPGDLAAIWADASRAEEVLGWRGTRNLDDIARTAWNWHVRSGDIEPSGAG